MFSRHRRPRALLMDFRLGDYSRIRGIGLSRTRTFNVRAAWSEAEIFVMRQLRMGCHPDYLEREIETELLLTNSNGYTYACLGYARRILRNLRNSGQFDGLPTCNQFEQINLVRPRRARYEMMMYNRFGSFDVVTRYGGDIDIAREIARSRALDREAEEELRMMREQDRSQLEEQYRVNEETLRAELQDAMFRAESAETRLQFERQRAMGPMLAGANGPVLYQYDPIAGPRMREPYYAADLNGRNQYNRYRDNQMPYDTREVFGYQRPHQSDPYQRPPDEGNWRNMRGPHDPGAREGYAYTDDSEDSRYRRRR